MHMVDDIQESVVIKKWDSATAAPSHVLVQMQQWLMHGQLLCEEDVELGFPETQ